VKREESVLERREKKCIALLSLQIFLRFVRAQTGHLVCLFRTFLQRREGYAEFRQAAVHRALIRLNGFARLLRHSRLLENHDNLTMPFYPGPCQSSLSSLQILLDDLEEFLNLFRRELAVFSEDNLTLLVKSQDIAAVIAESPLFDEHFLVITDIDRPRIFFLFLLERRGNQEIGHEGRCHIDDGDRLEFFF
jgi:hypothetical protein